jgi:RNA polymerase sigma-32 factor
VTTARSHRSGQVDADLKRRRAKPGARRVGKADGSPKDAPTHADDAEERTAAAEDRAVEPLESEEAVVPEEVPTVDPRAAEAEGEGSIGSVEHSADETEEDGTGAPPTRSGEEPHAAEATALVPADSFQRYLTEIRRYPLLSAEEEHTLATRWKEQGDRSAAARLITSNLRLVVMIARQYQQAFRNLLDLIQEGNIGLLEAVKNFDPYRGVRFPSYAVWWIRAYIIRYVMNNWRLVKLGTTQAQRKLFFNLQREKDRLEREGFRPDPKLIADRLGVKQSEVIEMEQRLSGRDVSVDAPVGDDGDASMLDFLPDRSDEPEARFGDAQYRQLVGQKIREFGAALQDKEKVIFDRRMIAQEPLTLQEIGEQYDISRERVRQIEERIRKRLRAYLLAEIPDIKDVDVRMNMSDSSS